MIGAPKIRVGVLEAGGRMGTTVCQAVLGDPELELVAAVDPQQVGIDLRQLGVHGAGLNVARTADVARGRRGSGGRLHGAAPREPGMVRDERAHAVVGTSGFEASEIEQLPNGSTPRGQRGHR
jgi:4-hydroxy-tetrahydrodipicolinate reductase